MRVPYLCLLLLSSIATAQPVELEHDTAEALSALTPELIAFALPGLPESDLSGDADSIAGKGNRFSQKQKMVLKKRNAAANNGKVICEKCNNETVPAEKHEKNVTPPKNEAHTDHRIPRAKGGPADLDNGQILCRDCNLKKSDKTE